MFKDGLLNDWNGTKQGWDIPIDSVSGEDVIPENTRYIAQPRREAAFESEEGIGYRYQIDIATVARIKAWSEKAVSDLVSDGVFPTFKNVAQSKKRRFDANQIIGRLREFSGQGLENRIEVNVDSPEFRRNFTSPGKLVNDILKQWMPGGFDQNDLLSRIYVDESMFRKWLVTQRTSATRRSVPIHKVTSALDCTEQDIRRLVQEKNLKWATHQEWQKWVDGPSLFDYMISLD